MTEPGPGVCRFDEHAGTCDWIACENPDPSSPSSCPLPWPKADTPIREQSALELLETHAKALEEEVQRVQSDFMRVVIANAEVAKLNAEQAETIERLRAALTISRGQWVHSVNARQCLEALGERLPDETTTPRRLEDHENYCNEHGGHLRDSPACYLARERAR